MKTDNPFMNRELMKKVDITYRKTSSALKRTVVTMPLKDQIKFIESVGGKVKSPYTEHEVWRAIEVLATLRSRKLIENY